MAVEDTFGPAVASSCVGGFDFTLLFEESILTVLPLGIASTQFTFPVTLTSYSNYLQLLGLFYASLACGMKVSKSENHGLWR
jgi:hypothetical protein